MSTMHLSLTLSCTNIDTQTYVHNNLPITLDCQREATVLWWVQNEEHLQDTFQLQHTAFSCPQLLKQPKLYPVIKTEIQSSILLLSFDEVKGSRTICTQNKLAVYE